MPPVFDVREFDAVLSFFVNLIASVSYFARVVANGSCQVRTSKFFILGPSKVTTLCRAASQLTRSMRGSALSLTMTSVAPVRTCTRPRTGGLMYHGVNPSQDSHSRGPGTRTAPELRCRARERPKGRCETAKTPPFRKGRCETAYI